MIVAYRVEKRAVLLHAFAKNERENVTKDELEDLRQLGSNWLNASSQQIARAIGDGALQEIEDGDEKDN